MTAGAVGRLLWLVLAGLAAGTAGGALIPVEVRVRSAVRQPTVIMIQVVPDAAVEDRTPGARPPDDRMGAASVGQTFADEIVVAFPGVALARATAVDVGDELVSTVRLEQEGGLAVLRVFVRRPVTYAVTRTSPTGEVAVTVRARALPTGPALAPQADRDQVAVDAEFLDYDQEADVLVARGNVTLTRGEVTLRADEVRYDRRKQIAEARGHVVLVDPDATVEGESARLDLDEETGWIDAATGEFAPTQYQVKADRIEKGCGPVYDVARGEFTTCRCGGLEKPSWSLGGDETHVRLEGLGVVRGATLRVKDVPILWLPIFAFPANTERQSGFLFPRLGFSNRRGFQYEQPFYWAINKSSDATVALDVETEARIGAIAEYRYVLSKTTRGAVTGAYYNERIRGTAEGVRSPSGVDTDIPENRFMIAGTHRQRTALNGRFHLDVFAVSDDLFLREINNFTGTVGGGLQARSTRFTRSDAGWLSTWRNGYVHLESRWYQDLYEPQDLVVQRLPQLGVSHQVPLFGGRAVVGLPMTLGYFHREEGFEGGRIDLAPEVVIPVPVGRWLSGDVTGRVRETVYALADTARLANVVPTGPTATLPPRLRPAGKRLPRLDTVGTRETAEVSARLGTEFARTFDFGHFGLDKMRHTIEPELRYLWVPRTDRDAAFEQVGRFGDAGSYRLFSQGYLFDEVDSIRHRNLMSWGVTSRLFARTAGPEVPGGEFDDGVADPDDDGDPGLDPDVVPAGLPADIVPPVVPARRPRAPASSEGGAPGPTIPEAPLVPASHEILRASVLHGYDPSRRIDGKAHGTAVDLGLRLTPTPSLGLSYSATVSPERREILTQSAGGFLREPWWSPPPGSLQVPSSLALSYRLTSSDVNSVDPFTPEGQRFYNQSVEQLSAAVYLRLTDFLGVSYGMRYDLSDRLVANADGVFERVGPHFLDQNVLVRLISRCNCWMIDAGYTERYDLDERLFRIQVTLVGLGTFGRGAGSGSYVAMPALSSLGYRRPTAVGGGGGGIFR